MAGGGDLTVVSQQPAARSSNNPILTPISVTFDRPVMPSSVTSTSFSVYGRWSGPRPGTFSFSNGDQTVTLMPDDRFAAGDVVLVTLSHDLQAADSSFLRSAGYSYQFWTRTRPSTMNLVQFGDPFSNRINGAQTRIYGASASDLNGDGYLDLTTVNEVSADLRVFLNNADGTGTYGPMLLPPFPIGIEASPNEPADFNRDGRPDLCTAASTSSSVWIVMGNGDGTFASSQAVPVGNSPHGVAVLDVDGDGDMDIATSNTGGNNVSLMLNNGSGVFGAASAFEGGGNGEYALSPADMNNDGIMDLVVGARGSQQIIIQRGNGDGTFTPIFTQNAGGLVWMIACGDVNGDGNMDVTAANSNSSNGAILLGNGAGAVAVPQTYPAGAQAVATDLGDLDGDGDADWILSAFTGNCWRIYRNNGAGSFSFVQDIFGVSNPSCAVILDIDNDRDLDLALTDEIADVITLRKNSGTALLGDFNNDADVDGSDYTQFEACFTPAGVSPSCQPGDFNGDDDIDCDDWTQFESAWTAGGSPPNLPQCVPSDCNNNGIPDATDIANCMGDPACGDCNNNGLPDECDSDCDGDAIPDDCGAGPCWDGDACSCDTCMGGACVHDPVAYGDVNCAGTAVDLDDILCVLDGFGAFNLCPNGDIAPCAGNRMIDLDDILAVLDAFGGADACSCP